jgi:predicted nucleotidyltransferase
MPLPEFNSQGDLPPGVYRATLNEVVARFGRGTAQRQRVTERLRRIFQLAQATGKLDRLIIFGSYVTSKLEPNDVDVVIVFQDSFEVSAVAPETRMLLDHERAEATFGASIFWIRPAMIFLETFDEFIAGWQVKRDQTKRGIVEVFE